jgi:hypothetical protein
MAEAVSYTVERGEKGRFLPKPGRKQRIKLTQGYRLLAKVTYGHLCDIIRLAPYGREMDKIAMLRAAQSAILGHLVGEIENPDNARRRSLSEAFRMLHDCEIETAKLAPDIATAINGASPPGTNVVELHLPDFVRRPVDDDDG